MRGVGGGGGGGSEEKKVMDESDRAQGFKHHSTTSQLCVPNECKMWLLLRRRGNIKKLLACLHKRHEEITNLRAQSLICTSVCLHWRSAAVCRAAADASGRLHHLKQDFRGSLEPPERF